MKVKRRSLYRSSEQVLHFPSGNPLLQPTRMATIKERALFRDRIPSPVRQFVAEYDENPEMESVCELCGHNCTHEEPAEPLIPEFNQEEWDENNEDFFLKRRGK